MHRWNNEDDEDAERFFGDMEDQQEQEEALYISEEEYQELMGQASEIQQAQLELAELDLNQRLLSDTIAMLRSSWSWPFKSTKRRLREIGACYRYFQRLTEVKDSEQK